MAVPVKLAIDAMSGDHGTPVTVRAALSCLQAHDDLELILVGDETVLNASLRTHSEVYSQRLKVQHASEVVAMDELPSKALRQKKDSSMRVAVDLLKQGRVEAVISAGNTGALMATARFVLKTLPGIDRPAIVSPIPAVRGQVHMLDLGANVDSTPEQLFQFAVMGSALITAMQGVDKPSIALLNIGSEEIKGNETIKQAASLLQASHLNYVGYVEGDGIFLSDVDLVVCDGFAGNVALKTGEGAARMIGQFMRQEFGRSWIRKLTALTALRSLKALARRIDPREHNGATLLGLNGTVIKSHGSADAVAFARAIEVGIREVRERVPERVTQLLADA
ncbi:MAG: phosphate acyltransferase PlsX [Panacagrimonas sp.]